MDGEDSIIIRVRLSRMGEQPCGPEVGGGGDTGCHCVVQGNIFFLLQDCGRESKFGSEGEAIMGGLHLGIYCPNCATHFVDVLACGSSQNSLQRLCLQFLHRCVSCQRHGEVLTLAVVNLD